MQLKAALSKEKKTKGPSRVGSGAVVGAGGEVGKAGSKELREAKEREESLEKRVKVRRASELDDTRNPRP